VAELDKKKVSLLFNELVFGDRIHAR
jgi:hypothetical protein